MFVHRFIPVLACLLASLVMNGCVRMPMEETATGRQPIPDSMLASLRAATSTDAGGADSTNGAIVAAAATDPPQTGPHTESGDAVDATPDRSPLQRGALNERGIDLPPPVVLKDELHDTRESHVVRRVTLRPAVHFFDDQTLLVDIFAPNESEMPRPLIVVLPILGGGYSIADHFATMFAHNGFAAAIVHREERYKHISESVEELNRIFEQMILDHHQALDFLVAQPGIDGEHIGVFGISAGAVQGALVYAIDDRIRAAVLALVGGDLPHIFAYATDRGITRRRNRVLEEHGITADELYESLKAEFRYDPLDFAPYMDATNALLILARFDRVIPYDLGMQLRDAMGGPETIVIASGHYSAIVYLPVLDHQASQFFKERLGRPPPLE